MATALMEPVAPETTEGPGPIVLRPRSLEQNAIDDLDPFPTINRIVVRQLAILPVDQGGPFAFLSPGRNFVYSQSRLESILSELRNGSFSVVDTVDEFNRPLDLNLSEPTCFVLALVPTPYTTPNWQFSTDTAAITLGDFQQGSTNAALRKNYFNLRHVLNDNVGQPAHFLHPDKCRIAYFYAKKTLADFYHPININVEMYYQNDSHGKNTIPIVIDPDVRYPGGSGVDGGPP